MTKAFVETTILADALVKNKARSTAAKSAIKVFTESLLPVYAIKEFKTGVLRRAIWIHAKLFTTGSWSSTYDSMSRMLGTLNFRYTSTALEILSTAAEQVVGKMTLSGLVKKYGPNAREDTVLRDRYRFALGSIIRLAWKNRRKLTTAVVDDIPCYPEDDIVEDRGVFEIGETKCQVADECALAKRLRADLPTLEKLLKTVEAQPSKPENKKRAQALKDIIRFPRGKISPAQCVQLGDAIFAFFCPLDAIILSTNIKDLRPLAECIGKKAQTPAEGTKKP